MKTVRTPEILDGVPDQPKTKHRSVRVNDEDWADLETAAKDASLDRAKVINQFIRWYLHRPGAKTPKRPDKSPSAR